MTMLSNLLFYLQILILIQSFFLNFFDGNNIKKVPISEQNGEFYLRTSVTLKLTFIIGIRKLYILTKVNNSLLLY